jgi:hypothetical protein
MVERRIWGLTAGLLVSILLVGSGAHAATYGANPGGDGGSVGSVDTGSAGRVVSSNQDFRVLTGNNTSLTVYRTCTGTATPLPAATVVRCYLYGRTDKRIYDDVTRAMSGPASTINQVLHLPVQPYTICVRAWGLYGDGSYEYSPKTTFACR